jgi:hypothetical protein
MTASILRMFHRLALSPFDKALCELFIGAFFFAMRSCKYVKVHGPRKTKLLTVKNINFYCGKRCLLHGDPLLHMADCVSITFELQKHDTKMKSSPNTTMATIFYVPSRFGQTSSANYLATLPPLLTLMSTPFYKVTPPFTTSLAKNC